ncbi:MAG: CvpA family protein [Desulfobacterales bacterium]|nr:CvpA family protein [Desulfobacterales bacterium]
MNAFDIVVAVILAYSLIRGLFRGLVKEVASIIGVLGGFLAAYSFYGAAAGYLSGLVSNPAYRNILAFMVIFCGVVDRGQRAGPRHQIPAEDCFSGLAGPAGRRRLRRRSRGC